MPDTPAPAPVFDFENVSRRWEKQWRKANIELTATAQMIESENVAYDDKLMAIRSLTDFDEVREKLLSQIVVSIPREWLVKSAPKDIDWSDVTAFDDWLQVGRFKDLVEAVNMDRSAKN
jgi:hypothetical protein